ncbi:MAG: ABC transporter substrate-binding protein [Spirochaetales bacterium]|nr:ABC transporter substrate-binding protein [Spirochaetales bacterium]
MKKNVLFVAGLMVSLMLFAGGNKDAAPTGPETLTLVAPTGFPAITLAEMIVDSPVLDENVTLEYKVLESSEVLGATIISGEADLFIAPTNLGVNLYNKGEEIVNLGSLIWGLLYIATTEDISTWEDLRGREIAMIGRGLSPDIITRHLLTVNGLDPEKDVTLNYVQNTTELAPSFIAGKLPISMMPEPALSVVKMKRSDTKIMLDLQKEWEKISGNSSYPQVSLFAKAEVVKNNPQFIQAFVEEYAASIARINADPAAASEKAATYLATPPAPIMAKSIPGGNLNWAPANVARGALEDYISVLIEANPASVGGQLPDDDFYYPGK